MINYSAWYRNLFFHILPPFPFSHSHTNLHFKLRASFTSIKECHSVSIPIQAVWLPPLHCSNSNFDSNSKFWHPQAHFRCLISLEIPLTPPMPSPRSPSPYLHLHHFRRISLDCNHLHARSCYSSFAGHMHSWGASDSPHCDSRKASGSSCCINCLLLWTLLALMVAVAAKPKLAGFKQEQYFVSNLLPRHFKFDFNFEIIIIVIIMHCSYIWNCCCYSWSCSIYYYSCYMPNACCLIGSWHFYYKSLEWSSSK